MASEAGTLFREARRDRLGGSTAGWITIGAALAAGIAAIALTIRILAYPLQHDEQFYVPAGVLFSFGGLYRDLGYSHLPNLPLLLSAIDWVTGTSWYLLTGRLVILVAWAATVAALWGIGRRSGRDAWLPTILMIVLLLTNPVLLAETGMAVTNNFVATPLILFGFLAFVRAVEGRSAGWAGASGLLLALAIGCKANLVVIALPFAVAALVVPRDLPLARRLSHTALPMLAGAIVGGAPTLYFLASDPSGFIAHAVHFHRGPQIAYWLTHPDPAGPKIMTIGQKLFLAQQLWLGGATIIIPLLLAVLGAGWVMDAWSRRRVPWPTTLMAAIAILTALAGFVPTPAFPQYLATPLPFLIALIGLIHAEAGPLARRDAKAVMIAGAALSIIAGGPMLLAALPKAAHPAHWGPIRLHHDAARIAALSGGGGAPIATLEPLYALEGRQRVYPELAMGPFVYRAGDWVPAADRRHYAHLASPTTIGATLAADPPKAILTGGERELDDPLTVFARDYGYRTVVVPLEGGKAQLAITPDQP